MPCVCSRVCCAARASSVASTLVGMQIWQKFIAITVGVAALHGAVLWAIYSYKSLPDPVAVQPTPVLVTRSVETPSTASGTTPSPVPKIAVPSLAGQTAAQPAAARPALTAPSVVKPPTNLAKADTAPAPPGFGTTASADRAPSGSSAPSQPSLSGVLPSAGPAAGSQAATNPASPSNAPSIAQIGLAQLPSLDADHADTQYRHPLPAMSVRLGEFGRVVVRVQVGLDGKALQVVPLKSSGYPRLDDNALATVARWRFKPSSQAGAPVVAWVEQPVTYAPP